MGTFPVTSPSSTGWSISGGSTLQFIDPTNLLQSWHVISPNTEYHITYYLLLVYYFDLLWHRILISLILVLHIGPKSECIALFAFLNQKSFLDIHQPKPPAPLFNQKSFPYIHESFVQLVPPTNQISETDFRHVLLGLPTPQPPLRGYVLGSVRASYLIVIFSWKAILVGGFSPTHLKNMRTVKLDHFPRVSGWKYQKNIWNHHLEFNQSINKTQWKKYVVPMLVHSLQQFERMFKSKALFTNCVTAFMATFDNSSSSSKLAVTAASSKSSWRFGESNLVMIQCHGHRIIQKYSVFLDYRKYNFIQFHAFDLIS